MPKLPAILLITLLTATPLNPHPLWSQQATLPPSAINDQNPDDVPLTPEDSLRRIVVPEGFHVTQFAAEPDVAQPIAATFDDRGRLWVLECYSHPVWQPAGHDRILIFEDEDGDGRFDSRKIFWDKGNYSTGLAFGHGGVWICNDPFLLFVPDRNSDDVPDGPAEVILDGWSRKNPHNVLNNLTWGPDGWLYGSVGNSAISKVGRPGTVDEERQEISRGIWRLHPTTFEFEVVALGAVNPWGMDFNDWGDGFFTNCVIGHLWHLVPGAYYQRRNLEKDYSFAYSRIAPIADHLHWGGGTWQSSRGGLDEHSVAGGGHAHTGAMVYLGDNWPEAYRNTFITGNLHGNRLNHDILEKSGSGYVARHGNDFLLANDLWFRCLWQKYGPDGGVYLGDWHDFGECHDNDGSYRTSGRIYKVTYGVPTGRRAMDLNELESTELARLQLHHNDWFCRHSRRILHERSAAGLDMDDSNRELKSIFETDPDVTRKLRALWSLYVSGGLDDPFLIQQLDHPDEHVRLWSVRLLFDHRDPTLPSSDIVEAITILAGTESSARVRLAIASAALRLPAEQRWDWVERLLGHESDAEDHNLPHMVWYALAPLGEIDPERSRELIVKSKIGIVRRHLAHRHANNPAALVQLLRKVDDTEIQSDILTGIIEGLRGGRRYPAPKGWSELSGRLAQSVDRSVRRNALLLGLRFNDTDAVSSLVDLLNDRSISLEMKKDIMNALVENKTERFEVTLLELLDEPTLRQEAIRGLSAYNSDAIPERILALYPELNTASKQSAISLLASRPTYALRLLAAIETGPVQQRDVSAFTARQLASLDDDRVNALLNKTWGVIRRQSSDKRVAIAKYKQLLSPRFMQTADPANGRVVFSKTCQQCHRLFGEGSAIGPDLTGSNRTNLDYVLDNIIDPSAEIGRDFQLSLVSLIDGRVISGIIVEETDEHLVLQSEEQQIAISKEDVDQRRTSETSMMPEGQLDQLTNEQIRDLISYLQLSEQVPLRSFP